MNAATAASPVRKRLPKMTLQDKTKIANSFSSEFDSFQPKIKLTVNEFQIFEEGVYAKDMDEKWNIFVLDNFMYWAHSWTDTCIYKVQLNKRVDFVHLEKVFVSRDKAQYRIDDIDKDKVLFFTAFASLPRTRRHLR